LNQIKRANFPSDLETVLRIYKEYIKNTVADLGFQNNDEDFKKLADDYSDSSSQIFLAYHQGEVVGCAAFRKVTEQVCEMKRVYVHPTSRGMNTGRLLVSRILVEAKASGYKKMCLDVLPEFKAAYKLYISLGFKPHEPISFNPVKGTKYLGIEL
jgi:L-amino acid N-acyltransferase YncA